MDKGLRSMMGSQSNESVKSLLGTKHDYKLVFHESVAVRTGVAELGYERAGQNLTTANRPRRFGVARNGVRVPKVA